MSKWAYICCEQDLHEYNGEALAEIIAENQEDEPPFYIIHDTKESALREILATWENSDTNDPIVQENIANIKRELSTAPTNTDNKLEENHE